MDTSEHCWRHIFVAALTEIDSEKFAVRMAAAADAVFHRLLDLEGEARTDGERSAPEDTMQDIRLLRDYCYHFLS
jgi:hypothetical protein